jgi:hypothetical protein
MARGYPVWMSEACLHLHDVQALHCDISGTGDELLHVVAQQQQQQQQQNMRVQCVHKIACRSTW